MVKEGVEKKFKDPDDPLRLVFVCALWTTGFDIPSCSTIYLGKPMKNHPLMQTIARGGPRLPGQDQRAHRRLCWRFPQHRAAPPKRYGAAYLALIQLLGVELWTLDGPLARNAADFGLPVHLIE